MKINIWKILHIWRWLYRQKYVVKDSENQHNEAARRRKHNLQYALPVKDTESGQEHKETAT
jgi:hypothetical protein